MQPRKCENCGLGMLPFMPRRRGPDGKLWCRNCHEGRPGRPRAQASRSGEVGAHPDALSPTTVEAVLAMEAESERLEAAEAILGNWALPDRLPVVEAHDSGDGQTIFHCPFCLSWETRLITRDGEVAIGEVVGTRQMVLTGDGFDRKAGHWVEADITSFGEQPLWKITLTRNGREKVIRATAEHRWLVTCPEPGERHGRSHHREVQTQDLHSQQRLSFLLPASRIEGLTPSPLGVAHGVTFGDGSGTTCSLWGEKDAQLLRYFPEGSRTSPVKTPGGVLGVRVSGLPSGWKQTPDLDREADEYLYGWLAGYFAADGDVNKQGQVTLTSANREHLEFVQVLAHRLGVGTFGIRTKNRRGCAGRGLIHDQNMARHGYCSLEQYRQIHSLEFVSSTLYPEFFLTRVHRSRYEARDYGFERIGWMVKSVEPTGEVEEVFCPVVPGTQTFALADNIWTHNCGGGQVIGRSDGTTECDFCHQAFTVQVQPQISSMPQTVNGQPMEMPGMPGGPPSPDAPFDQDTAGGAAQPPGAPQDAFVPPGDAPVPPGPPGGTSPPFQPPQKRAAGLQADAGRFPCPGSNVEPLPSTEKHGERYTQVTPTFAQYHAPAYGVCPECHEPKKLLASGKLPKHTRHLSWKEQQEMGHEGAKQAFYVGPEGVAMSERSYIHHLAARFADDREQVLVDIRRANGVLD